MGTVCSRHQGIMKCIYCVYPDVQAFLGAFLAERNFTQWLLGVVRWGFENRLIRINSTTVFLSNSIQRALQQKGLCWQNCCTLIPWGGSAQLLTLKPWNQNKKKWSCVCVCFFLYNGCCGSFTRLISRKMLIFAGKWWSTYRCAPERTILVAIRKTLPVFFI